MAAALGSTSCLLNISNYAVMAVELVSICHHFQDSTQSTLGGTSQWMQYAFKNVDYDALLMHTESLKINIFKVLFWEGWRGSQKRVLCLRF